MRNDDLTGLSIEALLRLIETIDEGTNAAVHRKCRVLYEYRRRGKTHPHMRNAVFKWFREVAQDALHPAVVMTFAGLDDLIRPLIGLPLRAQEEIARGGEVVPLVEAHGADLVETKTKHLALSPEAIRQVYAKGHIRSASEQKKYLRDRMTEQAAKENAPSDSKPRVTADPTLRQIIVGGRRYSPSEMIEPLRQLGFRLVSIEQSTKVRELFQ